MISGFSFEVDIDDLIQRGSVETSATGTETVTFSQEYNSTPIIKPTIIDAASGDTVVITGVGTSSFGVQVLDGTGNLVVRTVTWEASGW